MKTILRYLGGLILIGIGGWVSYLDWFTDFPISIYVGSLAFMCCLMGFAVIFKPKLVKEIFLAWLP